MFPFFKIDWCNLLLSLHVNDVRAVSLTGTKPPLRTYLGQRLNKFLVVDQDSIVRIY